MRALGARPLGPRRPQERDVFGQGDGAQSATQTAPSQYAGARQPDIAPPQLAPTSTSAEHCKLSLQLARSPQLSPYSEPETRRVHASPVP